MKPSETVRLGHLPNVLSNNSQTIKQIPEDISDFRTKEAAERMLEILLETVGKNVVIIGIWNDRPTVVTVNSVNHYTITGTIKKTSEEIVIAAAYIVLALRTSARSRRGMFSRSRGCEFILRLNCPPASFAS